MGATFAFIAGAVTALTAYVLGLISGYKLAKGADPMPVVTRILSATTAEPEEAEEIVFHTRGQTGR